jgi:hypothetical protein
MTEFFADECVAGLVVLLLRDLGLSLTRKMFVWEKMTKPRLLLRLSPAVFS